MHVLTTFNLRAEVTISKFQATLGDFERRLRELDLVESFGEIGRRHRNTIMDTDEQRDHDYFFLMSFRDREQCDRAIALMRDETKPTAAVHLSLFTLIDDPIFSCWEDVARDRCGK